jgi:hypothetical protein
MLSENWYYAGVLLYQAKYRGNIYVQADFVNECNDECKLQLKADLITRKFLCFGVDNPYLLIERSRCLINKKEENLANEGFKETLG